MGATSDSIAEKTSSTSTLVVTESAIIATKTTTWNDLGDSIDLLGALQLHNTTQLGVTQVPGLVRLKPAYYLQAMQFHATIFTECGLAQRSPITSEIKKKHSPITP
ncbi:hypothetical protein PV325_011066 [Microctonus aethiopoides]|nr:hypothetical protein PV325_011066 [Microctonus aethiopoides]